MFAEIHHDYKHYITIEIFGDRIFGNFKHSQKIPSKINARLQYFFVQILVKPSLC